MSFFKRSPRLLALACCSLWTFAVLAGFWAVLARDISRIRISIEALARPELNLIQPQRLTQILFDLEQAGFIECAKLSIDHQRYFESPECQKAEFLDSIFLKDAAFEAVNGLSWKAEFKPGTIKGLVVFFSLIWSLGILSIFMLLRVRTLQSKLRDQQAAHKAMLLEADKEKAQALMSITSQVAHDIRSPLAALDMVLKSISELPEDKRLLVRSALGRIKDIANNLLHSNLSNTKINQNFESKESEKIKSIELLSSLIESLISEKRMQFRSKIGIEIDHQLGEKSYGIFANINATEFNRLLSNLVNNAVEALGARGRVTIALGQTPHTANISIADDGQGIPLHILSRLGQRGETHGKSGGSGLGLYHARTSVESWGGRLEIDSMVGLGTTVTVKLPLTPTPQWFVDKLKIKHGSKIVMLDDDSSIHRIWQGRFESARINESDVEQVHLSTPLQLKEWIATRSAPELSQTLFLLDYELLGFSETGLDLIELLDIQDRSILVTSRFEESSIRARCEKLNVRLIPKAMAAYVPVEIEVELLRPDAILIDDDTLVHATWKMAAQLNHKQVRLFATPEAFFEKAASFARDTHVYVDVSLPDGVRGEMVAEQVFALGFSLIWLTTGYAAENVAAPKFIRAVVGKDPPF